jgi:hypothetical protein
MCNRITKIRGIRVCGRSVYRTDTGLKIGYRGPNVDVDKFIADLNWTLAQAIRDAVQMIDAHHAGKGMDESITLDEALDAQEKMETLRKLKPDTVKPDNIVIMDDDEDDDLSIPGGSV